MVIFECKTVHDLIVYLCLMYEDAELMTLFERKVAITSYHNLRVMLLEFESGYGYPVSVSRSGRQ